jgi:ABC-2 type transport system permease protein
MEKPANLMTDFIDATRDQRQELYDQPDSLIQQQLNAMFPEIPGSPASKDSAKTVAARNESTTALVNELMKSSITVIEADNQIKNKLIRNSFVVNPVIFFQNRFNTIAQTHFNDYQQYREEIQVLIDKQIRALVIDTWQEVKVDKEKYMEYIQVLSSLE